jgi:hypothetical protein
MFYNKKTCLVVVAVDIIDSCNVRMVNSRKNPRVYQDVKAIALLNVNKLKV